MNEESVNEENEPKEAPATEASTPAAESAAEKTEAAKETLAKEASVKETTAQEAPAKEEAAAPEKDERKSAEAPSAAELLSDDIVAPVGKRKSKGNKNIPVGVVHVKSTFNNTIVSITDMNGAVISWGSAGRSGFKGSRKSTAYAATVVAQEAGRQAMQHGLQEVEVRLQGPGAGRESALRAIQAVGITVTSIRDVTPVPHNGCRPPKRRRV